MFECSIYLQIYIYIFGGNLRRWNIARERAKRMDKKYKRNRKSSQRRRQNTKERSWQTINENQKYNKNLVKKKCLFILN